MLILLGYLIGPVSLFAFRLRATRTIMFSRDILKFGDLGLMFSLQGLVFSASMHFLLLDSSPASEHAEACSIIPL
jgi:hypothetical protein